MKNQQQELRTFGSKQGLPYEMNESCLVINEPKHPKSSGETKDIHSNHGSTPNLQICIQDNSNITHCKNHCNGGSYGIHSSLDFFQGLNDHMLPLPIQQQINQSLIDANIQSVNAQETVAVSDEFLAFKIETQHTVDSKTIQANMMKACDEKGNEPDGETIICELQQNQDTESKCIVIKTNDNNEDITNGNICKEQHCKALSIGCHHETLGAHLEHESNDTCKADSK